MIRTIHIDSAHQSMHDRSEVLMRPAIDQARLQRKDAAIAGALVLGTGIGQQIVLARLRLYSPMTAVKVRDAFGQALLLHLEVEGKNLAVELQRMRSEERR